MSGVTYADLVTGAGDLIAAGALQVCRDPFLSRESARAALGDFHGVLDALESHTWSLIGPSRIAGISPQTRAEPVVAEAIAMVDGLRDLVGADRPHPSTLDAAHRSWAQAALRMRAASDLLAVHLDPWGKTRSPDAPALGNAAARDAALIRVAGQLDTALATEITLALRCLQAGISRTEVRRWLPGMDANRAFTHHLSAHTRDVSAAGVLDGLRLIGETPRITDPVLHAADLIHRLRQATWALPGQPDYSVATLSDLATAGLAINAHTAAAHGADLTRTPPRLTDASRVFVTRAATWRDLRTELAIYKAPGPADPAIRADVLTLRNLLARLAPMDGTAPPDARVPDLLMAGTEAAEEIAVTAGGVFAQFGTHGHLHVHARHVTGDQVGDDPDIIVAKLAGTTITAPAARWHVTTDLWNAAAGHTKPSFTPLEAAAATRYPEPARVLTRQTLERSAR